MAGIAASLSARVQQYAAQLITVPSLVNSQSLAFLGTRVIPNAGNDSLTSESGGGLFEDEAVVQYLVGQVQAINMMSSDWFAQVSLYVLSGGSGPHRPISSTSATSVN